jgi:2-polyprenyl-6-methoxyphenol hydroxylase-like FAD-dependent oxidoreductase
VYDVIVVGARCAGSPTAMLLARKGYRVLLVDRATFPSDTPQGHFIHLPGVARLKRWGLLDAVAASSCPPVTSFTFDVGPFALTGFPPPFDGATTSYAPRRTVLDAILLEAAGAAGAELRTGFAVEALLAEGDRVTGIRGRASGGAPVAERARLVIGADGLHSLVARAVRAPTYHTVPPLSIAYWSYWSGVPIAGGEVYLRERCALFAMPTNDDLAAVALQAPVDEFAAIRADVEGSFARALALAPHLAERVRRGRREMRFLGRAGLAGFFRRPYGAGWALVGDAGYHKDPYTGQGISDAFRDAELLADAIDAGLAGRQPLEEALAAYERQRNEAVLPMYEFTRQLAALEPPPPAMQQLFAALRGNQVDTDRFFGVIAGTVPPPEFLAPDNVARIVGAPRITGATAAVPPPSPAGRAVALAG